MHTVGKKNTKSGAWGFVGKKRRTPSEAEDLVDTAMKIAAEISQVSEKGPYLAEKAYVKQFPGGGRIIAGETNNPDLYKRLEEEYNSNILRSDNLVKPTHVWKQKKQ